MKRVLPVVLITVFLISACQPATQPAALAPTSGPVLYTDSTRPVETRVQDLLARMTLEEKIGQMTQVEKGSLKPGDITRYFIGSVLSGGGGSPKDNSPQGWLDMLTGFQDEALATRLAIPLIYGVDAVHGHNNLHGATIFPHNIGLGAANDPDLVERIGQATAAEMLATGVPWNFAPVVAVPQDIRWGRTYEGYSEDTAIVTALGAAFVRGLQAMPEGLTPAPGQTLYALATPKHFIGDGGTLWGSARTQNMGVKYMLDQGNMQVDEATLRRLYLPPYQAALQAGAQSVMASFSSWKGTKMHAQQVLLTGLLKDELGFPGFIVSDWQAIDQIDPDYYTAVVKAINAGVDMNMVPYDYLRFINTLKRAVERGDVPLERVDDAVRRILRVKFLLGLFEQPSGRPELASSIRSPEHLALAREAVRKSLVLLRNANQALPIAQDTPVVFVAGAKADDIGLQCGGWTMTWQGQSGDITPGTTLREAVEQAVSPATQLFFDRFGNFKTAVDAAGSPLRADVAIVVVGEAPYAEGVGDSANPALSQADADLITRVRERAARVVVVIVSGRPIVITEQLSLADAWVAAWLPGTEAAGVTDVLFGDQAFTGRLPYAWPRSVDQLPFSAQTHASQRCDGPLFPLGYGLTAADTGPAPGLCPAP